MRYPSELIEEIQLQNNIVDVISVYVPLKQKGTSYFGLCPFHNEKTPSFSVDSEKQFYYCFGCGAGGNVYSFVMQMENCDFVEAVKRLADRVHITLPEPEMSVQAKQSEQARQRLFELHKEAGRFFHQCLHQEIGKNALAYLQKRQVRPNIQTKFGIGFAPPGKQNLYNHLKESGYSDSEMLESGLILESKTEIGQMRDRFYNRVMFPILDLQGRVIGFGGRNLGNGEPKYLNSPETILFHKGKNLYSFNFARGSKRREVILVEGYMDVISIYQAGFHNVAASLGTAFGQDHASLLKKYMDDVILLYDSDEAGTNAALRAIPFLIKSGLRVKVLQVPDGKDPDEYIKQNGSQEFSKLLVNAVPYITFQINCVRRNYNLENVEHKIKFTTEAAGLLAKLDSDIERNVYVEEVVRMTGVDKDAIQNEINKLRNKEHSAFMQEAEQKRIKNYSQKASQAKKAKGVTEAQRDILYLWASDIKIFQKSKNDLIPEDFIEPVYQKTARLIGNLHESQSAVLPASIVSQFDSVQEQQLVTEIFAAPVTYETPKDREKAFNDELKCIKLAKIDKQMAQVDSVEKIQGLLDEKRKLDTLYIPISDG